MFQKNRIIIVSLIIFVSAVGLAYLIFYNMKYKKERDLLEKKVALQVNQNETNKNQEKVVDNNITINENITGTNQEIDMLPEINDVDTVTGIESLTGNIDNINENINEIEDLEEDYLSGLVVEKPIFTGSMLPGTTLWQGELKIINDLGLQSDFILTDINGIYFAHISTDVGDNIKNIVENIGGTIFEINDRFEIENNQLFGDKVTYINLPEYKDSLVNILVRYDLIGDIWLIQIDKTMYYDLKPYLQELFNY